MKRFILLGLLVNTFFLNGCAGSGEVVQLRLYDIMNSEFENMGSNVSVTVPSFEDQRPPSQHLGMHNHLFGGVTYFDLVDGNIGKGVSETFVEFLNKSGFQATTGGGRASDISITGKLKKFSANANGTFLSTYLKVDAVLEFVIANAADGSTVRMTIGAGGTDDVVFFSPEDMEDLVNEVLEEGFEELLEETAVKGRTLRRKG